MLKNDALMQENIRNITKFSANLIAEAKIGCPSSLGNKFNIPQLRPNGLYATNSCIKENSFNLF